MFFGARAARSRGAYKARSSFSTFTTPRISCLNQGKEISRGVEIPGQACVTRRFDLFPLTCMLVLDRGRDQPQSTSNRPLQSLRGASDYFDSSWPIYLMYSKIAEEKDNNMTERCQKYTDGILIFVSPHVTSPYLTSHTNWKHRVVYSLPPSVRCLLSRSLTSSQTRKTPPHSTYGTSTRFWAIQTFLNHRSHLL